MAIDFPSSPSVNDQFTAGNVIYEWDGNKWVTLNTLLNKGYSDTFFSTPSGTTAERPSVADTGYFRFNETLGRFEGYDGSNWISFGEYGNSVKFDDISSSFNGILVDFSITVGSVAHSPLAVNTTLVSLGGVIQEPGVDYTINGSTLTFTTAPTAGLAFHAIDLGATGISTVPPDGSITTAKLDTDLTVDLASGTAAAPSLTFDADTGLYSPGADQVAISTNGAGRLFIDSAGRVGIGTTSPGKLLHVAGDARIGASDANDCGIELGEGATGNRSAYIDFIGDTTYTDFGLRIRRNNGGANTDSNINHRGTGKLLLNAIDAGSVAVNTNGSERMRIDSSGAIGLSGANYGTSGQVMTSNGSGSAPTWQDAGGAWNLISTVTASSASTVDFTSGIDSTYKIYKLIGSNLTQNGAYPIFQCQFYNNGTLVSGSNYKYSVHTNYFTSAGSALSANDGGHSQTEGRISTVNNASSTAYIGWEMTIYEPSLSRSFYLIETTGSSACPTNPIVATFRSSVSMYNASFTNINGIRILPFSSNTMSGTFKLYGIN